MHFISKRIPTSFHWDKKVKTRCWVKKGKKAICPAFRRVPAATALVWTFPQARSKDLGSWSRFLVLETK
jgi:hypothetical protein